MNIYRIADQQIQYDFLYPETTCYFERFQITDETITGTEVFSARVSLNLIEEYMKQHPQSADHSNAEYNVLALPTSRVLLMNNACLFHSVAFSYRGKAILLTGRSGVGKTTQYAQWKRNCGDTVKVISGDLPALVLRQDGNIWAVPSPWNGKENLHSEKEAPVGGIIVLEQAPENTILPLSALEAILPVYSQMRTDRTDRDMIRRCFAFEDLLLCKVPVWKLSSRGDLASAQLCLDTIAGEIYG